MNLAKFGLVIDPTQAEAGGKRVTAALGTIHGKLKEVDGAAAKTGKSLNAAGSDARNAGNAAGNSAAGWAGLAVKITAVAAVATGAVAAFKAMSASLDFLKGAISRGAEMEDFKNSWAFVLGTFDKAKAKMQELATYAQNTPFDLPGVNTAALALDTLKNTGLETMKGLQMVGDAAGKANQPIQEVASRITRLIGNLQRGAGGGDETRALSEWRVLSSAAAGQIMEMGQDAKNFPVLLQTITKELEKASGSTLLMSTSWNGMMAAFDEGWEALKATIGEPIITALKPMLEDLTVILGKLKDEAAKFAPEIQRVVSYIPAAFKVLQTDGGLKLALTAAWDAFADLMERHWVATGTYLKQLFTKLAYEFGQAIKNIDWSSFSRAITDAIVKGVEEAAPFIANLGASFNAFKTAKTLDEQNAVEMDRLKKTAEIQERVIRERAARGNDGSVIAPPLPSDMDLPNNPGGANAPLVGPAPPEWPTYDAGSMNESPAMKDFGSRMWTAFEDIAKWMKETSDANNKLVEDKFAVDQQASLFPKAMIERDDDTKKEALVPGSDESWKDAVKANEQMVENNRTAQEVHDQEIMRISARRDAGITAQGDYDRAVKKTRDDFVKAQEEMAEKSKAALEKQMTGVQKLLAEWGNLKKQVDQAGVAILQNIEGNITDGIVSMIDGTKSASQAFADMAKGIVNSILQIITRLVVQYALMSAMGMAGGLTFTSFAGASLGAGVKHAGGEVGGDGPTRQVPAAIFDSAKRYHTGGVIAANEVPIIAERGETVLTKDQANDIRARLSGKKEEGMRSPDVHIINVQNPQDIDARIAANPQTILNAIGANAPTVRKVLGIKS